MSDLKQSAYEYAKRGLAVVPIDVAGSPLTSILDVRDAKASLTYVNEWWERWPTAGIGLVVGKPSGVTVIRTRDGADPEKVPVTACIADDLGRMFHFTKYDPNTWTMIAADHFLDVLNDGEVVPLPPTPGWKWVVRDTVAEFPKELRPNIGFEIDLEPPPPTARPEKTRSQAKTEQSKSKLEKVTWTQALEMGDREVLMTKKEDCLSFGYSFLDDALTGIFPGELVLLGGMTGTGKSTVSLNVVYKAARAGHRCFVMALEDRIEDYAMKAIFYRMNLNASKDGRQKWSWNLYRRNEYDNPDFAAEKSRAKKELANDNIIFAKVDGRLGFKDIESLIDEERQLGTSLFLIDHLHHLDLDEKNDDRAKSIENFMVDMRNMQRRNGARVILVAHYRKTNGSIPTIDSFKDSSGLGQNASYVINLYRERGESFAERKKKGEDLMRSVADYGAMVNQRIVPTYFLVPKARNPNGEQAILANYDKDLGDYVDTAASEFRPMSEMRGRAGAEPVDDGMVDVADISSWG